VSNDLWRRIARAARGGTAWILLAGALACIARAESLPSAAPESAPRIRLIEKGRDDPALRRIETMRAKLPEKFRRRRNFAWAVAKIDGLEKVEYFAHSGVDRRSEIASSAPELGESISLRRKHGRFTILCVNHDDVVEGDDCFPRSSDTEYKIIEDMASRLPNPSVTGRVRIYTDLYPCASCRHVMQQFLAIYTNVHMQVLYREAR
jgi:hypothetical protein